MGCHPRKYKSSPKSHPRTLPLRFHNACSGFLFIFRRGGSYIAWLKHFNLCFWLSGMLAKDKTSSAHFPSVALCHSIRAGNSLLCYWVNLTLAWIRERTPRVKHISLCQLFSIRQQRHVAKWPPSGSDMCWHHMVCKSKQHGSTSKGSEVLGVGGRVKGSSSERKVFFGAC